VAVLALRFASGAVGSLHIAYTLALHGGGYHNQGGYDTYHCFSGRAGRLYWGNAAPRLHVESTSPSWTAAPRRALDFALAESPAYGGVHGEDFVRDFILACQGADTLPASGRDALQVARVVDGAYESSREGRRVKIMVPEDEA
jgi:predicted dehydrogenase